MAQAITYTGPVNVVFQSASEPNGGNTDVALGYSRDGAQIRIMPSYSDVKSDLTGGEQGVPLDRQFLGAIARINVDLTKYDLALVHKVISFCGASDQANAEAGRMQEMGKLQRQEDHHGYLRLSGSKANIVFKNAYVVDGSEFNVGMRASAYRLTFEAWMSSYGDGTTANVRQLFDYTTVDDVDPDNP